MIKLSRKRLGVKVGDALYESWGYDQTQNDFCRIISISPSGKTVKCQMVHGKVVRESNGAVYVSPSNNPIKCPPVRLYVRSWRKGNYFVGSYPFLSNISRSSECEHKRKGSFDKYTSPVYETAPGYGH